MLYLFFSPGNPLSDTKFFVGEDKVAHLGIFLIWSFLVMWSFGRAHLRFKSFVWVLLGALVFGLMTEWIQRYIPYRSSDLMDFVFDAVGAAVGLFLAYFMKKELNLADKKFDK
ncbi:MAG: VanZ family protein [Marinoscillum sp.]|uniref:VanZ family protein n=1 Tax=Marinoscillum sp. TaxID=2024838 RepID=UPI0032FDBAC0